jgi:hypothetical protein
MKETAMTHMSRWTLAALAAAALPLAGCSKQVVAHQSEHPSTVEAIPGSEVKRVTLTAKAAQRLDLATGQVREQDGHKVVAYSSLIYDFQGKTWVYTSVGPRTFVRQQVDIERIVGDQALLKAGPPVGTVIATVAVAQLYGTEFAVGH